MEQAELIAVFCREARERLGRARAAVRGCGGGGRLADCYNRIHQEFDSLCGAARAANLPDWEAWSRRLARLARHLRNLLQSGVSEPQHRLLVHCVDVLIETEMRHCRPAAPAPLDAEELTGLAVQVDTLLTGDAAAAQRTKK